MTTSWSLGYSFENPKYCNATELSHTMRNQLRQTLSIGIFQQKRTLQNPSVVSFLQVAHYFEQDCHTHTFGLLTALCSKVTGSYLWPSWCKNIWICAECSSNSIVSRKSQWANNVSWTAQSISQWKRNCIDHYRPVKEMYKKGGFNEEARLIILNWTALSRLSIC